MVRRQDRTGEEKRSEVIGVRVRPEQRKALERAALKRGLDLGAFMRMAALEAAGYEPDET